MVSQQVGCWNPTSLQQWWDQKNGNSSTGSSCFVCAFCGRSFLAPSAYDLFGAFCSLECAEKEKKMREDTHTAGQDVFVAETPWPCARCNLEPRDTVWRPLDGATPFDTEERICGACWLVEDDRGAGRGDTEDPWELQRLHDAWLEKEFFFKKKNNGAKKWPVKGCPDCGTLVSSPSMARHRRLYCKSRQPVALGSVRQGRPAEKDAVLSVAWICL